MAETQTTPEEVARNLLATFMNTIDEGEMDYSCNTCELDFYLCAHRFDQLAGLIAAAIREARK